jgi:hypothetical protein
MMRILLLLFLLLSVFLFEAQSKSYSKGYYYTQDGEKVEGYIKFKRASFGVFGSRPSLIKFKSAKKSKAVKLRANQIKAFVVESDSFCVVQNIKINVIQGEYEQDFAKVLISGPMNLYLHYSSSSDGQRSYANDRFVLSVDGSGKYFGLWNIKRQREDLAPLFDEMPTLAQQILDKEYDYVDLPKIVKHFNDYMRTEQEPVKVKRNGF